MGDDIIALLKAHAYFSGISDDILREIASIARVSTYAAGAVVHQPGEPLTSICFVLRGRLKAVRVDAHGREHLFRMFERGEQYGIMLGGLSEPLPVRIFALESSTILSLDHEASMELMFQHPDVRRQWFQTYARSVRRHHFEATPKSCAQYTCVASRIPCHAGPCSQARPAAAGVGRRDLRSQRRGHLAVDAGYAVSFAVRRGPTPGNGGDSPASCRVAPGQTHRVRCLSRSGSREDRAMDGRRSHLGLRATQRDAVGAPAITIAGRDGARLARQDQYRVAAGRGPQRGPGGAGTP